MGFPFDTPTWDGVGGAIFMGLGGSAPGLYTLIAVAICIGALVLDNVKEHGKYKPHK